MSRSLSNRLHRSAYGLEVNDETAVSAAKSGLCIAFYRAEALIVRGAQNVHFDCFRVRSFRLDEFGFVPKPDKSRRYTEAEAAIAMKRKQMRRVKISVERIEGVWVCSCNAPGDPFDVIDRNGATWCRGIVFENPEG